MFDFTDQSVVITGACGSLGRAVAEAFHRAGARLTLLDLKADPLETFARSLGALALPCDLTQAGPVAAAMRQAAGDAGQIDVLANIAGGFRMGPPLHETPVADFDFMLDMNARSVFNTCRAAVPFMLEQQRGRIVNVAARAAVQPKGRMAPYIASKAAVIALTEALAAEHKFNGINVNCILPGTIDTPQNRADMPDADTAKWVAPQALADVILFLASDAARAVSGAAIPVYGQS